MKAAHGLIRGVWGAVWMLTLGVPALSGCNSAERHTVLSPDPRPFEELARHAECADLRNRLFLIDGSLVLWDRAGSCADAAYSQALYFATPDRLVCRLSDSIGGPQRECRDPRFSPLFDTMLAHLDEPDLGLGPRHTVRPIPF